jgi:hypothetical protein
MLFLMVRVEESCPSIWSNCPGNRSHWGEIAGDGTFEKYSFYVESMKRAITEAWRG